VDWQPEVGSIHKVQARQACRQGIHGACSPVGLSLSLFGSWSLDSCECVLLTVCLDHILGLCQRCYNCTACSVPRRLGVDCSMGVNITSLLLHPTRYYCEFVLQ